MTDATTAEPFAHEKLSTLLALYRAKDFKDAVAVAGKLVALGGIGHTSVLYTDQDQQKERVAYFGRADEDCAHPHQHAVLRMAASATCTTSASRPALRSAAEAGAATPSQRMWGRSTCSIRRLSRSALKTCCGHKLPRSIYFRRGCVPEALKEIAGKKRALIVTDNFLFRNGYADDLIDVLKKMGLEVENFYQVQGPIRTSPRCASAWTWPTPSSPMVIIALGGGSRWTRPRLRG